MATTCRSCGYAYEGKRCTNPACRTVNPEAHARHQAEARKRKAEQDERDKLRRAGALSMARSAERTRRAQLSKARQVSGSSSSYRMPDGSLLTVRRDGDRWLVVESPQGGLAGGSQVFGSRQKADAYVVKRRRVLAARQKR